MRYSKNLCWYSNLSKLRKAKFFILCDVTFLARLHRGNLKLITLRSERVKGCRWVDFWELPKPISCVNIFLKVLEIFLLKYL